ncbi:sodium-dependent nutrient amino acid transporter 1 isoform X1 [Bactrocera neohumeralis]|uniref:sodium-dependent nutrient amino acid transporter 1 isoform X1 n=1 Tax=Bactrocera neohumeralis TaxID=98809 RepID=UPI002165B526|nr:sodium-dependent nutrient amino acid transporter 1 isoform X1 [Bactrocera neohumeralis]XP_050322561.1 sodium-dependent nutrient amino acid transporter 1 isoform X1 [Bactrocera neohumeralis]
MELPHENPAFIGDDGKSARGQSRTLRNSDEEAKLSENDSKKNERATWGKGVEFLFSCIAMSVGLGNVWRFPFTALDNGGGAFLIPYLIVLFLIGKPIYYLEMAIGQFSSSGSVKVFNLCPAMKGIGIGQVLSISFVTTYYVAIMGMIVRYLFDSFKSPLPWTVCDDAWSEACVASGTMPAPEPIIEISTGVSSVVNNNTLHNVSTLINASVMPHHTKTISSAELYFIKDVLREKDNIDDGIGLPNWELVLGLLVSWTTIFFVVHRGVKSSGKASYFLALFPYVIMAVLLVRAVTLPGSADGIIFFIKPDWSKILDPKVWYAAVTQCFYSLSVCFGNIIMYASYNKFDHNIHRDAMIVTTLDTFTSLISGFTIFGILGNLAYEIGTDDIGTVVKGGTGLAFISYPDAISKFKTLPQIFSVLFFLMLFILGIGSNIAMTSCTITAIRDSFPHIKQWHCALAISVISFFIGLAYVTPGGQFILTLVDFYGASMIALILGILELYVLGWVYGVDRLCTDIEFMIGHRVGNYWRWCWALITPGIMTLILIYFYATYESLTYNNVHYPSWAYALGWTITALGVLQVPIWAIVAIIRQPGKSLTEKVHGAFRPESNWGPSDPLLREQYNKDVAHGNDLSNTSCWSKIKKNLTG